jgi:hypothetical protein
LPEFAISIVTIRTGTWTIRVDASSATEARQLAEAECAAGECHCPAEACVDDLESSVVGVRQIVSREAMALHSGGQEAQL